MKNIYINGIGNISPQATHNKSLSSELASPNAAFFSCIEPEYKDFIQSKLLRRMSRVVKMGLTASTIALNEAENPNIDAIITGTAWGCVEDTEKFLETIIENNEEFLTPTAFVQSTHNTVAGQIALMHHNNCYNMTYVQGAVSFESALIDAMLHFYDNKAQHILVGGIDEQTDKLKVLLERLNCADADKRVMGEGASFFVLSDQKTASTYAQLAAATMVYKPKDTVAIKHSINQTLKISNLSLENIDLVLTGRSNRNLTAELFPNISLKSYQQLCGEYPTNSAFAMAIAANILNEDEGTQKALNLDKKAQHILIFNQDEQHNCSIILLSKV